MRVLASLVALIAGVGTAVGLAFITPLLWGDYAIRLTDRGPQVDLFVTIGILVLAGAAMKGTYSKVMHRDERADHR